MAERNDKEVAPELSLDDLAEVSGGVVVEYTRSSGWRGIVQYSCPQCGSKDLDGIAEGAKYASKQDMRDAIYGQSVRCRSCGYEAAGGQMTIQTWRASS